MDRELRPGRSQANRGLNMARIRKSGCRSFWVPDYFRDELSASVGMDLDCLGADKLLQWAALSSPDGWKVPRDERYIRNLLRGPSDEAFARILEQVLGKTWKASADGKWWEHHGLRRILLDQRHLRAEQKRKAKLGAAARWDAHGHRPGIQRAQPKCAYSSSKSSSNSQSQNETATSEAPAIVSAKLTEVAGLCDDRAAAKIWRECLAIDADCTPDEVVHFIAEKAVAARGTARNMVAVLLTAVPGCFRSDAWRSYRRHQQTAQQVSA